MSAKTNPTTAQTVTIESSPKRYQAALAKAKAALAKTGQSAWIIGDQALAVESVYGESTIGQFAHDLDMPRGTVYDYRSTAKAYPAEMRGTASQTVHQILRDQADRGDLVKQAMTTSAARELVKSRKTGDETDELVKAEAALAKAEAEVKRLRIKVAKIKADREAAAQAAAPKAEAAPKADKCSCGKTHRTAATAQKCQAARDAAKVTAPAKPESAPAQLPALHIVRGVPQHRADEHRADCSKCNPTVAGSARRNRRNRVAA